MQKTAKHFLTLLDNIFLNCRVGVENHPVFSQENYIYGPIKCYIYGFESMLYNRNKLCFNYVPSMSSLKWTNKKHDTYIIKNKDKV